MKLIKISMVEKQLPQKWERVLWKKQPFPDNYVSKSFFRVRTKCVKINLIEAFYGSAIVSQEICSCVGLVVIFWSLSDEKLNPFTILYTTGVFISIGYLITHLPQLIHISTKDLKNFFCNCMNEVKAVLFTAVLSWFSSPVIKSLTASVATDTIHACTTGLLLLHLILHPYGADVAIVNPSMSHNLGLFAAVCLASRLTTDLDVFSLVVVAIGLFTLLPTFRFYFMEKFGKVTFLVMSLCIVCSAFLGLHMYAPSLCPLFVLAIIFINGVSPLLFIYLQSYRKNIYGPWDEALIKEKIS